jgi:hypothetical protein
MPLKDKDDATRLEYFKNFLRVMRMNASGERGCELRQDVGPVLPEFLRMYCSHISQTRQRGSNHFGHFKRKFNNPKAREERAEYH